MALSKVCLVDNAQAGVHETPKLSDESKTHGEISQFVSKRIFETPRMLWKNKVGALPRSTM
jgi:hypothetical protein